MQKRKHQLKSGLTANGAKIKNMSLDPRLMAQMSAGAPDPISIQLKQHELAIAQQAVGIQQTKIALDACAFILEHPLLFRDSEHQIAHDFVTLCATGLRNINIMPDQAQKPSHQAQEIPKNPNLREE